MQAEPLSADLHALWTCSAAPILPTSPPLHWPGGVAAGQSGGREAESRDWGGRMRSLGMQTSSGQHWSTLQNLCGPVHWSSSEPLPPLDGPRSTSTRTSGVYEDTDNIMFGYQVDSKLQHSALRWLSLFVHVVQRWGYCFGTVLIAVCAGAAAPHRVAMAAKQKEVMSSGPSIKVGATHRMLSTPLQSSACLKPI